MTVKYYITTTDPIGFRDRLNEDGLGVDVRIEEGDGPRALGWPRVIARLGGWEVMWLGRHYPAHSLTPDQSAEELPHAQGQEVPFLGEEEDEEEEEEGENPDGETEYEEEEGGEEKEEEGVTTITL